MFLVMANSKTSSRSRSSLSQLLSFHCKPCLGCRSPSNGVKCRYSASVLTQLGTAAVLYTYCCCQATSLRILYESELCTEVRGYLSEARTRTNIACPLFPILYYTIAYFSPHCYSSPAILIHIQSHLDIVHPPTLPTTSWCLSIVS